VLTNPNFITRNQTSFLPLLINFTKFIYTKIDRVYIISHGFGLPKLIGWNQSNQWSKAFLLQEGSLAYLELTFQG
jgi:hypothetical protein